MKMELKVGDICKHFKGETLVEKNIYEILAVNVKYTGTKVDDLSGLVVYRALFQEDKFFTREYSDLVEELSDEEKEIYHQYYRVQKLTDEELEFISTVDFIQKKKVYIFNKHEKKFQQYLLFYFILLSWIE